MSSQLPSNLPPDVLAAIASHLGADASTIPVDPHTVLTTHLSALPQDLLETVGSYTTPKSRTRIPEIRARRLLYGRPPPPSRSTSPTTSTSPTLPTAPAAPPPPSLLRAAAGRLRHPLLWERLGGDPRAPASSAGQNEAHEWADADFMPGTNQFVGRLGRALAEDEEMREWEETRAARVAERRREVEGKEEFDSDSEDDEPVPALNGVRGPAAGMQAGTGAEDQAAVEEAFERQLLELFIDGLDTIDYTPIDFTQTYDPIAARDAQDAWFDDQAPSDAGAGVRAGNGHGAGGRAMENGQGEYDY